MAKLKKRRLNTCMGRRESSTFLASVEFRRKRKRKRDPGQFGKMLVSFSLYTEACSEAFVEDDAGTLLLEFGDEVIVVYLRAY